MSGLEARRTIAGILKAGLPAAWRIIPSTRAVDIADVPLVLIKATVIEPHPAVAVGAALVVTATVTVVSPLVDVEAAEDDLDDDLFPRLLDVVNRSPFLDFQRAELVSWNGDRLAYDLSVQLVESN